MSKQISKRSTRSDADDFIFGQPCKLSHVALPTWFDVGKEVLHKQLEMANNSTSNNTKNVKLTTILNQVNEGLFDQIRTLILLFSLLCLVGNYI